MKADLHPALKKNITALRFQQGLILFLGLMIGGAFALDAMRGVGGAILAVSIWAAWQLGRRTAAGLYRLDWLLRRTTPRTVQMSGTGLSAFSKHLVRFRIAGPETEKSPLHYALVISPGRGGSPTEGTEGVLHVGKLGENAELAIQSGERLYAGRRANPVRGIAELRRNKMAEAGLWLLITALAATAALKSAVDIGDRKARTRSAVSSDSWPTADGTVLKGRIETRSGGGHAGGTRYKALIVYAYTVSGERYVGDRRHFCDRTLRKRKDAQAVLNMFPPETPVTVHYDPENPSLSVLEPGYRKQCQRWVQAAWRMSFMYGAMAIGLGWATLARWRRFQRAASEWLERGGGE